MPALACPSGRAASGLRFAITREGRPVGYSHAWQAAMETDADRTRQFYRVCLDSSCEIPFGPANCNVSGARANSTCSIHSTAQLCISDVASNHYWGIPHTTGQTEGPQTLAQLQQQGIHQPQHNSLKGSNSACFAQASQDDGDTSLRHLGKPCL